MPVTYRILVKRHCGTRLIGRRTFHVTDRVERVPGVDDATGEPVVEYLYVRGWANGRAEDEFVHRTKKGALRAFLQDVDRERGPSAQKRAKLP